MNLLREPLIRAKEGGFEVTKSLPEVFAALVADRVDCFPALRPHQGAAWHMFLVQLGALAMLRAGLDTPPADAGTWETIIRNLTKDFPDDEPWRLVVDDWAKPAFLQPPVPEGIELKTNYTTPDQLDMIITSKGHDLKQSVAAKAAADDWIFALVSGQTGEGYNGAGNYGIARMNGGSSSRVCLGLSPMMAASSAHAIVRSGPRFVRDVTQLIARRTELLDRVPGHYSATGGDALTWTRPWADGDLLPLRDLDIFFIEVCRRVRLTDGGRLAANAGTSRKRRIDSEQFHGVVGDPWAPVHRTEAKALTLGDSGEFDYPKLIELLFSPDWELPILATLGDGETGDAANWLLTAQAFARGNSKTGGYKERVIPIKGRIAKGLRARRPELHELAKNQTGEISDVDKILRGALAVAAASGNYGEVDEQAYEQTRPARRRLRQQADRLFFPALWDRFEASETGGADAKDVARLAFVQDLLATAETLLDEAIADVPCRAIYRPRAEARARRHFHGLKRKHFPELWSEQSENEGAANAV